jgi:hypothetical protein
MTSPAGQGSAQDAAERNAQAVMAGNLSQLMADITPEVLMQMMQLGSGGGLTPQTMPSITGYELTSVGAEGETEVFHAKFLSAIGTATLSAKWKLVLGQWKIVDIGLVGYERVEE